jgi:lipopolysaccharide export system permease protein
VFERAFAENGSINPLLAVWLPNIIFGLITIYIYRIIPK